MMFSVIIWGKGNDVQQDYMGKRGIHIQLGYVGEGGNEVQCDYIKEGVMMFSRITWRKR